MMAKRTPEQQAQYALAWHVSRSDLSAAAQLEYDRLKADQEREAAATREAAAVAAEAADRAAGWVPGSYVPPVTGDEVRDTWFLHGGTWPRGGSYRGYLASDVDGLLRRVAAERDAGLRLVVDQEHNVPIGEGEKGYDVVAVDWFLISFPQDRVGLAGTSADPWRDVGDVAQLVRGGVSGLAQRYPRAKPTSEKARAWFAGQCQNAWRDFGQLPGAQLWWGKAGPALLELRTAEQQTLASLPGAGTVSVGGRSFSSKSRRAAVRLRSTADSWPPGVADIAARSWRDSVGHFAAATMTDSDQRWEARRVNELVDETGTPIVYSSGLNFDRRAYKCVAFRDGRWLRFPVRGTKSECDHDRGGSGREQSCAVQDRRQGRQSEFTASNFMVGTGRNHGKSRLGADR